MTGQVLDLRAFQGVKPSQAFQVLNPQDDQLADGIGSSYGVIGYKGKNWTLRYHGEKKTFTRPDDNSPINYIDVVILRSAGQKSKSYYASYDPNASEGARPICASLDGIAPDADVQQRQAETCAVCPRNVWRTNPQGRRERDCSDYKRLSVLLLPAQTQRMFGTAIMEPVFLRVPAGSLESLMRMSQAMTAQGFHSAAYITRVSFDPNEAHPSMVFTPLQPLTDAEAPAVLPLVNGEEAKRITGEDVMGQQRRPAIAAPVNAPMIAAPVQPAQPQVQPVSAAALVQQAKVDTQPAQPVVTGFVVSPQVQPLANIVPEQKPRFDTISPPISELPQRAAQAAGAFAVPEQNITVIPPQQQTAPVQQTVNDTGLPQESDAAMDDRIAAVLGRKS